MPETSIGYKDVRVTSELLEKYEREKAEASEELNYGKFKAWLFHANLARWQEQGHHFNYLTGCSTTGKQIYCTCGLFLEVSVSGFEKERTVGGFESYEVSLDQIQSVKGHRSLDDFGRPAVALIVDFKWKPRIKDYLWTAYCQECGAVARNKRNSKAKEFVERHNIGCGADLSGNGTLDARPE